MVRAHVTTRTVGVVSLHSRVSKQHKHNYGSDVIHHVKWGYYTRLRVFPHTPLM